MNAHAAFAAGLLQPTLLPPSVLSAADAHARAHRYAVYRNNSMHALVRAFEDSYPVLRALLGADCFAPVARACVRAMPPHTPVLAEYVQVLPGFIAASALVDEFPYLPDVARLEAACLRVYHAADAPSLPASAWRALQADPTRLAEARLRLHPACAWLACTHAAVDLWQAHMRAERPGLAELDGIDPDRAQDALLRRDDDGQVRVVALPPGCAAALAALHAGSALLPTLAMLPGEAAGALLAHLAGEGIVAGLLDPNREST